jgi:threonine/homoserine/homoserine lactone efflux protein
MVLPFLFKGLALGLSIAAPVGPIGVLCIRRTLAEGRAVGLVSGMGAATADALYGAISAFGLTFLMNFLLGGQLWLRGIGGLFLCYLGFRTFLSKPAEQATPSTSHGLVGAFSSTFLLTLTNPMTILSFAAVFAGLGITVARRDPWSAGSLVLGVFLGSALWWLMLSSSVALCRKKITARGLRWIHWIAGAMLLSFGIFAFLKR